MTRVIPQHGRELQVDGNQELETLIPIPDRELRYAFDHARAGLILSECHTGRIVWTNHYLQDLTGYTDTELCGMDREILIGPNAPDRECECNYHALTEAQPSSTHATHCRRKNGELLAVQSTSTLIPSYGSTPARILGILIPAEERFPDGEPGTPPAHPPDHSVEVGIARELHDHLSQQLLGAAFCAKALANQLPDNSPLSLEAADLARLMNSAVSELRSLIGRLNRSTGDRMIAPAHDSSPQ